MNLHLVERLLYRKKKTTKEIAYRMEEKSLLAIHLTVD
jgi:hypothetical protein